MSDITVQTAAKPDMMRFIKANIRDYALLLSLLAIMRGRSAAPAGLAKA